jgi:hypothetical protein
VVGTHCKFAALLSARQPFSLHCALPQNIPQNSGKAAPLYLQKQAQEQTTQLCQTTSPSTSRATTEGGSVSPKSTINRHSCLDCLFECTPCKAGQANDSATEEAAHCPAIFVDHGARVKVLARFQWAASRELAPACLLFVLGLDPQNAVGPRIQSFQDKLGCTNTPHHASPLAPVSEACQCM